MFGNNHKEIKGDFKKLRTELYVIINDFNLLLELKYCEEENCFGCACSNKFVLAIQQPNSTQ